MAVKILILLFSLCLACSNCVGQVVAIGETHQIHSSQVNEDREYKVYLPGSYKWAQDRRYPVLYVLDGNSHFSHTAASVDFLSGQGEIPEMIVVAVASTVRVRDFTQTDWSSHWVGGGGADKFRAFLSKELIPEIDKTYRTQNFRVLSGHSAGGQFALYCLTSEPSLFQAYLLMSPSLDWDDGLPLRSLESYFHSTSTAKAFVYVSRGDDYAGGSVLAGFNKLVEILSKAPQGVRSQIRSFPEETHTTLPLLAQIDGLRSLYSGWRLPEATLDKGLAAVQAHYEKIGKMLGAPVAVPENVINDLGYTALEQNKVKEAIAIFQGNVEANPNSAEAYDSLADGYLKDGQLAAAKRAAEHSVELARKWSNPNLNSFEQTVKRIDRRLQASNPGQVVASDEPKKSAEIPLEFLMAAAAGDFHKHGPAPARFRNVRIGHVLAENKANRYVLCGEFMTAKEESKGEWAQFVTIKTSGYEQWLGSQASSYCKPPAVTWDSQDDLSASLQSRLDSMK